MSANAQKPVIGLSLGLHDFGDYAGVGHQRPLALAGGVGFTLPRVNGYLDDALDACDGILFGGGRDVDPRRYGQDPTEHLGPTDPLRDEFELELVERALDRRLPVLGMCRGIQILNVALGGTLYQDLDSERPGPVPHSDETSRHAVRVEAGSLLERTLGARSASVNSRHHQAIRDLAPALKAVAWAEDGVIEGAEPQNANEPWIVAVQWHPEDLTERALFEGFARAVA